MRWTCALHILGRRRRNATKRNFDEERDKGRPYDFPTQIPSPWGSWSFEQFQSQVFIIWENHAIIQLFLSSDHTALETYITTFSVKITILLLIH